MSIRRFCWGPRSVDPNKGSRSILRKTHPKGCLPVTTWATVSKAGLGPSGERWLFEMCHRGVFQNGHARTETLAKRRVGQILRASLESK